MRSKLKTNFNDSIILIYNYSYLLITLESYANKFLMRFEIFCSNLVPNFLPKEYAAIPQALNWRVRHLFRTSTSKWYGGFLFIVWDDFRYLCIDERTRSHLSRSSGQLTSGYFRRAAKLKMIVQRSIWSVILNLHKKVNKLGEEIVLNQCLKAGRSWFISPAGRTIYHFGE